MSHNDGTTTLPRDFRYREPRTPEPNDNELLQPSPPRQRLKIRKRHASSLQAPTQQFLASVAAADQPIPTIEMPPLNSPEEDATMLDRGEIPHLHGFLSPQPYDLRGSSPPKTPIPTFSSEPGRSHRPDWSMGTPSPIEEGFFKRPTSAHSNTSDSSEGDSFYSGSRLSRPSDDDGSCTSPDSDREDPFQFPVKGKGKATPDLFNQPMTLNGDLRRKTRNDAPWTKAQSDHVWTIYLLYLQDPTVTPFRIGASAVPPEGVCHRVARECRRSWKGPKPSLRSRASSNSGNTPTAEPSKVYAAWPHSSAATRSHLRELCKTKNNTTVSHHRHRQSRSPTPFTKPSTRSRVRTPDPQRPNFDVKDISVVLATSTAESMQPDGPLAKLTASDSESETPILESSFSCLEDFRPLSFSGSQGLSIQLDGSKDDRLGSPFVARTYGPSSSKALDLYESRPSPRNHSDAGLKLRSPLVFDHSRSLNGTQKRRAQHDLEEELSPSGAIVRPSILNEQLFGTPLNARRVRSRGFSLGDEAFRRRPSGIFQPGFDLIPPPQVDLPTPKANPTPSTSASTLLPPPSIDPPRLGSPFSEAQTFPRRLFPEGTATIRRSAFATMHQSRRSIESFDFGAEGPSMPSLLQNVENKLRMIREREASATRQP